MSKKCCGIIYSENEKFCTKCGKPLVEVSDEETPIVLDMAEVDKIAASVLGEVEKTKEQSSKEITPEINQEITTPAENVDIGVNQTEEDIVAQEQTTIAEVADVQSESSGEQPQGNQDVSGDEDEDDDDEDEEDDGKASPTLKFFGTLMTLLMLASIVAVGLGIYFVKLNPFYKDHNINEPVVYEGVATDTDVNNVELSSLLTPVSIEVQTPTDAEVEVATSTDATSADAVDDENSDSEEDSESEE